MKRVEFPLPPGYMPPEGIGDGDEFDQICRFRKKGGKTVCLIMLGDTRMPGYERTEPPKDMAKNMGDVASTRYREHMNGDEY